MDFTCGSNEVMYSKFEHNKMLRKPHLRKTRDLRTGAISTITSTKIQKTRHELRKSFTG